ncbi:MAG TPA: ABC transporter permease [Syntrophorhabdaceae bacterium]|nr:ABC transporter permease [Syntrophorhabdaceae bacterium]
MVPFSYSLRNLRTRRLTTILTVSGMALVVFVFATILMLTEGLKKTLVDTGSYDNVVVIRKSSQSEVQSGVERSQASIVETDPGVASGADGKPLFAKELVVLIGLPKIATQRTSNVTIRGICPQSLALRPQVRLIKGRMPRAGSTEIATGSSIAKRFDGADLGDTLHFGTRDWRVVGVFDAGNTGFSSEVWADGEELMQAFKRPVYSSLLFRLRGSSQFDALKARIETDPRLTLDAKRETRYYLDQSEMMAKFLNVLGISVTLIFSLGAIIGAMITMYSAVANRVAEIGTMRALGFQKMSILGAFLAEALLLGLAGGLAGIFAASFLQLFTVSTLNFQTFSELAFSFTMTAGIVSKALAFALTMGFVGGVLPAFRAARMNIVESLRTR